MSFRIPMESGVSFHIKLEEALWLSCCDCGKVNKYKFRVKRGNLLEITITRVDTETAEERKRGTSFLQTGEGTGPYRMVKLPKGRPTKKSVLKLHRKTLKFIPF